MVEPPEAERQDAARTVGCILVIVILLLFALPFLLRL